MSAIDLARALDTANGPVRDLAMQMLVWRRDTAVWFLENVLNVERPESRLQALAILDAQNMLKIDHVRPALGDPSAHVRRHAVRLAEQFIDQLGADVVRLADNSDAQVRLQVAFSLGTHRGPQSGTALGEFKSADPFAESAVLSSLQRTNLRAFLTRAISAFEPTTTPLIRGALGVAVSNGDNESVRLALNLGARCHT